MKELKMNGDPDFRRCFMLLVVLDQKELNLYTYYVPFHPLLFYPSNQKKGAFLAPVSL